MEGLNRRTRRYQESSRASKRPSHVMRVGRTESRQQTLTQIDFVTKFAMPKLEEVEFIEEISPVRQDFHPRKRTKATVTETSVKPDLLDTANPKGVSELRIRHLLPDVDSDLSAFDRSVEQAKKNTSSLSDKEHPRTPRKRIRRIVPSSQSPEYTPLTERKYDVRAAENPQSPLGCRAHPRNTTYRGPETSSSAKKANELGNLGTSPPNGNQVSPTSARSVPPRSPCTKRRCTASAKYQSRSEAVVARATSCAFPDAIATDKSNVASSQATTQDVTQLSANSPTRNITTRSPETTPTAISSHEKEETERTLASEKARVTSSQATTVLDYSDPIEPPIKSEPIESPPKPRPGTQRHFPQPIRKPLKLHAASQRPFEGLTDSQLLPESLMNCSIPFPSSWTSQDHLEDPFEEPLDLNEQLPARISEEQRDGILCQQMQVSRDQSHGAPRKVKDEPRSNDEEEGEEDHTAARLWTQSSRIKTEPD